MVFGQELFEHSWDVLGQDSRSNHRIDFIAMVPGSSWAGITRRGFENIGDPLAPELLSQNLQGRDLCIDISHSSLDGSQKGPLTLIQEPAGLWKSQSKMPLKESVILCLYDSWVRKPL